VTGAAASPWLRAFAGALLIFPAPFAVQWLLLMLGGHEGSNGFPGLLSWLLPFAIASAGLILLPAPVKAKLAFAVLLFPALLFCVAWFGFGYVCSAYGDCL
jgi:hypothetical protein